MRENFTLARQRIHILNTIIGEVIGNLLALLFYFTVLIPFALISQFTSDPLHKRAVGNDFWLQREPVSANIDRAKRQG